MLESLEEVWVNSGLPQGRGSGCSYLGHTALLLEEGTINPTMKHKLESRLLGEISITSDVQKTPPLLQKVERDKRAS